MARLRDSSHRQGRSERVWFCITYLRASSYDPERFPQTGYDPAEPVLFVRDELGRERQFDTLEQAKAYLPHLKNWKSLEDGHSWTAGDTEYDWIISAFMWRRELPWNT